MKRKHIYWISSVIIITIVSILIFSKKEENTVIELNVSVNYVDNKFVITNKDTTDFIHADISIDNYYKLRNYNLQVGETYTIWTTEFLHHNGMHFSINRKPTQFAIWCETQSGKNGFYSKKIR